MIKIKITSIWQEKVGVRDKYLAQAYREKQGLSIIVGRERMDIPYEEIEKNIVAKSDRPFIDRYKGEWHYLFYFKWKPQIKQKALL